MPPQHVEIAETAAALRRKLRRERKSEQGETAQFATNRGNKLKPGARYVHAGSLPYRRESGFKEKITHAGYQRHILERNPKRYNGYGDELDDSDSDADADADAEEENPYGDVKLEELLRPLTHPSELASHPTLSRAYKDPALSEMVIATEAKIREERNNLWRAKNLYRYFTGDETWIPCERVEALQDWHLFEPQPGFSGRLSTGESPGKKRRLNGDSTPHSMEDVDTDLDLDVQIADAIDDDYRETHQVIMNGTLEALQKATQPVVSADQVETDQDPVDVDVDVDTSMADLDQQPQKNGVSKPNDAADTKPGQPSSSMEPILARKSKIEPPEGTDEFRASPVANSQTHNGDDGDARDSAASTPQSVPPPRRITRALAAEAETNSNPQIASPPPTSPTLSSNSGSPSSLSFQPHPTFLLPPHLSALHTPHPSYPPLTYSLAHSGLPPEELLETRKLLSLFIQKSEETLRGLEGILGRLMKARRRRDKVWEWCIAEGHVGEMSDGEDWIDVDSWGLTRSELRKGRDEDSTAAVVDGVVAAVPAGEAEADGQPAVVMGGRKGKRRRGAARD